MNGTNSQYLQKAHLHIVVLNILHRLAVVWFWNADDFIILSLLNVSLLALMLITNINNSETKACHFESIMVRNKTFDFANIQVQVEKKLLIDGKDFFIFPLFFYLFQKLLRLNSDA